MRDISTDYGTLKVGTLEDTFRQMIELMRQAQAAKGGAVTVGLSGGSTPQAFYKWAVREKALPEAVWKNCIWMTSDERHVPLSSNDSNFGNADREMLSLLGVPPALKLPWPVELPPAECAAAFNKTWNQRFGAQAGFDLCFLGMGDDGHTASLFPGCPLIGSKAPENFAAVEWPGRGWRLTITEAGLAKCGRVVVLANGLGKAAVLKEILQGAYDPKKLPSQIHRNYAARVLWLLDEAIVSQL